MAQLQMITGKTLPDPLQGGLFHIDPEGPALMGNRCAPCDRVFFPRRDWCACCSSPILDEVTLSRTGKIGAFSLIDRQPADAWVSAPYVQAEIELPEGVSVFTVLHPADTAALSIGQTARLELRALPTPDGTRAVYVFAPVADEVAA